MLTRLSSRSLVLSEVASVSQRSYSMLRVGRESHLFKSAAVQLGRWTTGIEQRRHTGHYNQGHSHAFMRPVVRGSIPTVDLKGNKVDFDEVLQEIDDFIISLSETTLVDNVHLVSKRNNFEEIKIAEMVYSHMMNIIPMPIVGREHREREQMATIHQVKMIGNPTECRVLQQAEKIQASGLDFLSLPGCLLVAKSSRTNSLAASALKDNNGLDGGDFISFPIVITDLEDDEAPGLAEMMGVGGSSSIVYWDVPAANRVAKEIVTKIRTRPWDLVKVEPGCNFFTFKGDTNSKWDIVVDEDYETSMETLAEAGFNCVPVKWRAMKSLGVSMRSLVLCHKGARGGYDAGASHTTKREEMSANRFVTHLRPEARKKADLRKEGVNLQHQWMDGRAPEACYQAPPRYAPAMHQPGAGLVPHQGNQSGDRDPFDGGNSTLPPR